jgi:5-methylcytosine-specific restriction endonuclease McrA
MGYDINHVLRRDRGACRLRFGRCSRRATEAVLDIADWLGGQDTLANARVACERCAKEHRRQRLRAAEIYAGMD